MGREVTNRGHLIVSGRWDNNVAIVNVVNVANVANVANVDKALSVEFDGTPNAIDCGEVRCHFGRAARPT